MEEFEVWMPEEPTFRSPAPGTVYRLAASARVRAGDSLEYALEEIFAWGNLQGSRAIDDPYETGERSLSVGDVVTIAGRSYVCESVGWATADAERTPAGQLILGRVGNMVTTGTPLR